jgi:hypothetical protein
MTDQSIYVIHSYYYVGDEPDDSTVQILGYTDSYEKAELVAKNEAESILSKMEEHLDDIQSDIDECKKSSDPNVTMDWSNGCRPELGIENDTHGRVLVGCVDEFDQMDYVGNSGMSDYCIICIEKVKNLSNVKT